MIIRASRTILPRSSGGARCDICSSRSSAAGTVLSRAGSVTRRFPALVPASAESPAAFDSGERRAKSKGTARSSSGIPRYKKPGSFDTMCVTKSRWASSSSPRASSSAASCFARLLPSNIFVSAVLASFTRISARDLPAIASLCICRSLPSSETDRAFRSPRSHPETGLSGGAPSRTGGSSSPVRGVGAPVEGGNSYGAGSTAAGRSITFVGGPEAVSLGRTGGAGGATPSLAGTGLLSAGLPCARIFSRWRWMSLS